MKTEVRYIAFDGAIFYDENECKNYEEVHSFAGLDKVTFYDIGYNVKTQIDGETLQDFIDTAWAIRVNTAAEARRVWSLLENYETDAIRISNPLLSKTGELIEKVLIFDGDTWASLPQYLNSTFDLLRKVGCDWFTLVTYFKDYCGVNKDAD